MFHRCGIFVGIMDVPTNCMTQVLERAARTVFAANTAWDVTPAPVGEVLDWRDEPAISQPALRCDQRVSRMIAQLYSPPTDDPDAVAPVAGPNPADVILVNNPPPAFSFEQGNLVCGEYRALVQGVCVRMASHQHTQATVNISRIVGIGPPNLDGAESFEICITGPQSSRRSSLRFTRPVGVRCWAQVSVEDMVVVEDCSFFVARVDLIEAPEATQSQGA